MRIISGMRIVCRPWASLVLVLATLLGCEGAPKSWPPLPATAEGLQGTAWDFGDAVTQFDAPPNARIFSKKSDTKTPIPATYAVRDGIIEVTVFNRTRAGIWDGRRLVIDGTDGTRIEPS